MGIIIDYMQEGITCAVMPSRLFYRVKWVGNELQLNRLAGKSKLHPKSIRISNDAPYTLKGNDVLVKDIYDVEHNITFLKEVSSVNS